MTLDLTNRDLLFRSIPKGGIGLELGVQHGHFSTSILEGSLPSLLWLIDCWCEQHIEVTGPDSVNVPQEVQNEIYIACVTSFANDPRVRIFKAFSDEAASVFPSNYFDFIYIDANHMDCYADMGRWWPKLKSGGFFLGHDYAKDHAFFTVYRDVNRFVSEKSLSMQSTNEEWPSWVIQKP